MMVTLSMMTKEKNAIRFRHEWKHMINRMDDQVVSSRLRKLFPHDAHADSHGIYRVSSLYFDTPYDKALRQKMDGVNQREKFRIRYYNSDLSFIRLEKKMKVNGLCAKRSARLTKTQVEQILRGDLNFLLKSDEPLWWSYTVRCRDSSCARQPLSAMIARPFCMNRGMCVLPWIAICEQGSRVQIF